MKTRLFSAFEGFPPSVAGTLDHCLPFSFHETQKQRYSVSSKASLQRRWEKRFLSREKWSVRSGCTAEKQLHYTGKEWMGFLNNILNALFHCTVLLSDAIQFTSHSAWCCTWASVHFLFLYDTQRLQPCTRHWSHDVWGHIYFSLAYIPPFIFFCTLHLQWSPHLQDVNTPKGNSLVGLSMESGGTPCPP